MIVGWKSIFGRVLTKGYFSSEYLNDDLECLRRFLMKWRLDLGSEGCFELNGMIEIVG